MRRCRCCPQCRHENPGDAKFCLECGRRLGVRGVTNPQRPRRSSRDGVLRAQRRFEVDAAEAHYRQAQALAEELGLRPLIAHCHLGLGVLSRRTGKRQEAREHIATAVTMFGAMDMRSWRELTEAALKDLT